MSRQSFVAASIDLLVGMVAAAAVFLFVEHADLEFHSLATAVALVYLAAGMVRRGDGGLPIVVRTTLISAMGLGAILFLASGLSTAFWVPFPIATILGAATGLLSRRRASSLGGRWSWAMMSAPAVVVILIGWLVLPSYFEFFRTYLRGPAEHFELVSMDGESISSRELEGKVLLLEFWDTHCIPCRHMMPYLEPLQERYEDDPRVAILVVNAGWESLDEARTFVEEEGLELTFAYDPEADAGGTMRVSELPTTVFIDRQFYYHSKHVAYVPGEEESIVAGYGALLEELLADS